MSEDNPVATAARPCPCCDIEGHGEVIALALGVALGVGFPDGGVAPMMCGRHRRVWGVAVFKAALLISDPGEGE